MLLIIVINGLASDTSGGRLVIIVVVRSVIRRSGRGRIGNLKMETSFIVTRCLKITEKVSFNIASEASYVYI